MSVSDLNRHIIEEICTVRIIGVFQSFQYLFGKNANQKQKKSISTVHEISNSFCYNQTTDDTTGVNARDHLHKSLSL